MIYWELCKRLKNKHTTKWYIHKPKSTQENEIHKILRDSEMQTSHLIPAMKPNLGLINERKKERKKENLSFREFYRCSRPQSENKRKQKDKQIFESGQKSKKKTTKLLEQADDGDTNRSWYTWSDPQEFERGLEQLKTRGIIEPFR